MKTILLASVTIGVLCLSLFFCQSKIEYSVADQRARHAELIESHPFSEAIKKMMPNEKGKLPPRGYFMEDYLRTMDPATGMIYRNKIYETSKKVARGEYASFNGNRTPGSGDLPWVNRGPIDVAGRVRAIIYDPKDPNHKAVYAGGVSGGLWYNSDITDPNEKWQNLSQFWANTSISCIAVDPNNSNIMYVGTGEIYTNDIQGLGVYRTMDGGSTWEQIFAPDPSYNSLRNGIFYITDIEVRNNGGTSEVYVGVGGAGTGGVNHGFVQAGLYKSVDNGNSFSLLPTLDTGVNWGGNDIHYTPNDIEISPVDNSVWVGTIGHSDIFSGLSGTGLKIFKSTNAAATSFSEIFSGPSPTYSSRVQIALSHQDANVAYTLFRSASKPLIQKTSNAGSSWQSVGLPNDADNGIPADDFTRSQSWYDLVMAIDPRDHNKVYVGGIDIFRTIDAGTSWEQISKWSWNNNLRTLPVSRVHADQHAIVFNPNSNEEMLFGNDGGVFYIADNSSFVDSPNSANSTIQARNNGFNITQFYSAKLKPNALGSNEFIVAGAQDNGTQGLYGSPTTSKQYQSSWVSGGDGAMVLYDNSSDYFIHGYVRCNHYLRKGTTRSFDLLESANRGYGYFINEITLDENLDIAYAYRENMTIFRMANLANAINTSTVNTTVLTVNNSTDRISHLYVSPYTTSSTKLFLGTVTGKLWRVDNANAPSPTYTELTVPFVGTVSSIKCGQSEMEMLVTVSNYNVNNVWYSSDGGASWQPKDGNLPDMPVRDVMFDPTASNEVLLATEAGVWSTDNITSSAPTWSTSNNGLQNVRITELDYRASDDVILAATYGRGVYTSSFRSKECTAAPLIVSNPVPVTADTTDVVISTLNRNGNMQDLMGKRAFMVLDSKNKGFRISTLDIGQMNSLQAIPGMVIWNDQLQSLMFYDGTQWKKAARCINQ